MITHRITTRVAPEPSVKFYRSIAITFLIATIALLGVVIFFTSKKATIVVVAKSDNKNVNLSVNVGGSDSTAIAGVVSSTIFKWSEKYFPTGTKSVDGIAIGEVVIYNKTNASQALVKTTRLLTPEGVLFRLSERADVPANGQAKAKVYADKSGITGDIGPSKFTIPGLNETKQKVIYAESVSAMSGGARSSGVLSDADLQAAETDYLLKMKQAATQEFSSSSLYDSVVVAVKDSGVKASNKAGDEVSEFSLSGTSSVVAVYYNSTDLNSLVSREISDNVDVDIEKVTSVNKAPQVSLTSYDLNKNTAILSVYQDAIVTIDSNAEKLSVANFVGKKKEQIERYVLGLSHVVGVEIKFSPSWMRTAPGVSDRIKVIVKNIK